MRYQGETFDGSCRTALTPLTRTALTPLIRGAGGLIPFPLDKGGRGVTLTRGAGGLIPFPLTRGQGGSGVPTGATALPLRFRP